MPHPSRVRPSITAVAVAAILLALPSHSSGQAPATRALTLPMPGIEAFHPVTTTIACGSNAAPESMAALAKAGFKSVVSFREDGEPGYDRPGVERAAADAGLRFVSVPFNREHPDPVAVQRFLDVIAAPDVAPAFIYCHTGQRAAAMWLIKRVKQDGWAPEKALAEAESLGLTRPELKAFALQYVGAQAPTER